MSTHHIDDGSRSIRGLCNLKYSIQCLWDGSERRIRGMKGSHEINNLHADPTSMIKGTLRALLPSKEGA